jgi:hypothetical protein
MHPPKRIRIRTIVDSFKELIINILHARIKIITTITIILSKETLFYYLFLVGIQIQMKNTENGYNINMRNFLFSNNEPIDIF